MVTRRRKAVEQAPETTATDVPPGTEITVVWGEETISPVQYNSFRLGGHSITVVVQEGETAHEAFKRGWAILEEAADTMFKDKLRGFRERLGAAKGR